MTERIRASVVLWLALGLALTALACSRAPDVAKDGAPSDTTAKVAAAGGVTLCEHRVPADLCTKCIPALVPVFKSQGDWCDEHGVPESQCLLCNPDLTFSAAEAPADWCKEHGVPESMCTKCHPNLVAQFVEAGNYCREHGYPETVCPICHPDFARSAGQVPAPFPAPGTVVRLESAEKAGEAGIETTRVTPRAFARTLEVVGQLTFNENAHARLSARDDAVVVGVLVDLGDEVKAGQGLIVLSSSSIGAEQARLSAAQARVETARAAQERQDRLASKGVIAQKDAEEAHQEMAAAQADLDAARSALSAGGATLDGSGGRYSLTAPFPGTVVARDVVPGRTTSSDQVLIEIADLSVVWAVLEIPEADAAKVRTGARVSIAIEGSPESEYAGTITRMAEMVDPASRTVSARVVLPNPDRALKAGTFVRARIEIAGQREALLVPEDAIQYAESRALVFVRRDAAVFEPVAVTLGSSRGRSVEVVSGLEPGWDVVTTGAFLLKTEILKESIGAGCCEVGGDK